MIHAHNVPPDSDLCTVCTHTQVELLRAGVRFPRLADANDRVGRGLQATQGHARAW